MTMHPIPGQAGGLPGVATSTRDHLVKLQKEAMQLKAILSAIGACLDDHRRAAVTFGMLEEAQAIAAFLDHNLDVVSVPRGEGRAECLPGGGEPVLRHYGAWLAAREGWRAIDSVPGNENFDSPESLAFEAAEDAARAAILNAQPVSFQGLVPLVHLAWHDLGPSVTPDHTEYEEQASAYELEGLVRLWQVLTGEDRPPRLPLTKAVPASKAIDGDE